MSENTLPEQDEVTLNAQPPAPAEGLAGPLKDIDPERLKALEERLAQFRADKKGKTESGSEAPDAPAFDLSQFEVDPELEHLYQRATLEDTPDGPKWVVMVHQYMIHSTSWHIDGSGQPKGKDKNGKMQYRAKGLDHVINDIINGPEGILSRQKGWRLSALLPGAMGQGIAVFERQVKQPLPDPKPIIKPEEQPLEETTDEELARIQERAKEWTGEPDVPAVADLQEAADKGLLEIKPVEGDQVAPD